MEQKSLGEGIWLILLKVQLLVKPESDGVSQGPGGAGEGARERILSGVDRVLDRAETLVAVSVEVFSDGCRYDPETLRYIRTLGELHQDLARRAVAVAEVVCGIPVWRKGPPGPAATERAV